MTLPDDPQVRSEKGCFWIRYGHLKELYAERADLLKAKGRNRTAANRELFSNMGAALRRESGNLGGAPRSSAARCPCGAMTLYRAKVRYHYCNPAGPVPSKRDLMRAERAKSERDSTG
jgi:hypothetical protein